MFYLWALMHTLVRQNRKLISQWLLLGVFMVLVQFLLGGITRLTGSGLSITEWKPIMGFIPPMTAEEWNRAFELYRASPQFQYLNYDFTLADFKFIYFWEWFHRFWARLMGLVFLIPFVTFFVRGSFSRDAFVPFMGLFLLGFLQGAIGWIMVQSGLEDTHIYVGHIELATHFITAVVLMMYLYALYLRVKYEVSAVSFLHSLRPLMLFMLVIILLQLFWGGLMAGMHAGTVAPTWPSVNGSYWPESYAGTWIDFALLDALGIQWVHRSLAYLIALLSIIVYVRARRQGFAQQYRVVLIFVILQVALGIATVLLSPKATFAHFGVFEWSALIHQTVGLIFALSVFRLVYFSFSGLKKMTTFDSQ